MNNGNGSSLSYSQMRDYANQLKAKADNMNKIFENIKTQFGNIGQDGVWSGTAATQARAEFDVLSGNFQHFYEAVVSCSTYLNQVVANYEAADASLKNM